MVVHNCHSLLDLFNIYIYIYLILYTAKPHRQIHHSSEIIIQPDKLNLYYL